MKQALFAPNYGYIFGNPETVVELVKLAETSQWDGFFLYDHIMEWYKMETPLMHHSFGTLSACALVTDTIQLGTMVTPLNRRRPWVVARETLTIDQLSQGRFILGVGIGVKDSREFAAFSEITDMRDRAEILDESLQILEGLWSGEKFSFAGDHFDIDDVQFLPKPNNGSRIPIWVAGTWPNKRPFDRAAKYDGIVPLKVGFDRLSIKEYSKIVDYVKNMRSQNNSFEFVVIKSSDKDRSNESAEELRDYERNGATMHFSTIGDSFGSYDEIKDFIRKGPRKL